MVAVADVEKNAFIRFVKVFLGKETPGVSYF